MDDGALPTTEIHHGDRDELHPNLFKLSGIDHVGIACRDPEAAGKFYEQILGAVEFMRVGYSEEDRRRKRTLLHIFYHLGTELVELTQVEDSEGYPDRTNPKSRNTSPHWAFRASAESLVRFVENLRREGIPFNGPRSHPGMAVVSVYFRDIDGNNLEVATWERIPPGAIEVSPMGGSYGGLPWAELSHKWQPRR